MNHFRILQSNHQKNSIKLRSDRQRINDQLVYILIIQLFLAPFFFGSNRPAFWFLWSCTISGTTAWWLLMMGINGSRLGVALTHIRSLAALFILLACYMIAQILPLGLLVPQLPAPDNTQAILPINTISLAPGDTLLALIRWLSYGLLFFLVLQLSANASRAAKLNSLLFWCIAIHAFLGLALLYQFNDTIYGIPKWDHHGSATGGFTNRNSFATLLAFGCILGTVQIIQLLKQLRTSTQKKISGTRLSNNCPHYPASDRLAHYCQRVNRNEFPHGHFCCRLRNAVLYAFRRKPSSHKVTKKSHRSLYKQRPTLCCPPHLSLWRSIY